MLVIIKSVDKLITKTNSWPNLKIAFVLDIRQFMKTNTTRESPDQRPIGLKSITSDSICIKNIINIGIKWHIPKIVIRYTIKIANQNSYF